MLPGLMAVAPELYECAREVLDRCGEIDAWLNDQARKDKIVIGDVPDGFDIIARRLTRILAMAEGRMPVGPIL